MGFAVWAYRVIELEFPQNLGQMLNFLLILLLATGQFELGFDFMVLGIRILAPTPTPPPNLGEGPSATGVFRRFYLAVE
jgi:hypothetical protein